MRHLSILLLAVFPLVLPAQPSDSGQRTLEALLTEVRELRLAIERSTLLGARTQLATSQRQLSEAAVARFSQQLADIRAQGPSSAQNVAKRTAEIKRLEQIAMSPDYAEPQKHDPLEAQISQEKLQLDIANAAEQQRSAREAELAQQLQAARAQADDALGRIQEMEKALDAAIQQMLKPH